MERNSVIWANKSKHQLARNPTVLDATVKTSLFWFIDLVTLQFCFLNHKSGFHLARKHDSELTVPLNVFKGLSMQLSLIELPSLIFCVRDTAWVPAGVGLTGGVHVFICVGYPEHAVCSTGENTSPHPPAHRLKVLPTNPLTLWPDSSSLAQKAVPSHSNTLVPWRGELGN